MSLMVIVLSVLILVVGLVMGFRSSNNSELSSPFECGFDPMGSSRVGFSLRFFMILVLFVIFDFETVLVIPSAIWLSEGMVSNWSLLGFVSFLTMLFLGIFFEMKEGVLQWKG
uniref:NADH-ubiquinone oxidoreductase chain 3 n=1 Tax=Anodonta anatina TaxID=143294 RepID=A0A023I1C6_ANOAN|nr:NADH dehydrogenase subunit 3 [Anodonta anatina]AGS17936.1 NADH dehydrogenase subunit 3 [Anodonta anatina]